MRKSKIAVGLYFIVATLFCFACTKIKKQSPPNILLIISDDQGWSDFGFMGHESIETPHLDELAKASLCFTRGYATAPLCSPSLASIITGLYAHKHGITGNDPTFEFDGKPYSQEWRQLRAGYFNQLKDKFYQNKLLTQYLSEVGYRSFQTGKWWLGSAAEGHFDAGMSHGDPTRDGRHGDAGLDIGRTGLEPIYSFIEESQNLNQPFFVWYAPFLPHTPHDPPDLLLQKYLLKTDSEPIAKYWAMCEWFDQTCGDLIDYIQDMAEETLVIFTTDNGWIQKPHENGYADRSKRSPYEMGIRTPFLLHWPGTITPQFDTTTLVSNIDIVPTILSVCQVETDAHLSGINLLSPKARGDRKTVFAEAFAHDIADINQPTKSLQYRIALEYPWKLIVPDINNLADKQVELFNISNDPDEKGNLAIKNPSLVVELQKKMDDWWLPEHLQAND